MKISISGASGHVGTNLIPALLERGHELKVLFYNDKRGFEHLPVETIKGDLLQADSLEDLVRGSEVVFHLAAQISITGDKDGSVFRINTEGTKNMCEACLKHGIRRMVHFSSIHSFNARPFDGILNESRQMVGKEAFRYDFSKATGENMVREYVAKGLDAVIINPTSVIGPGDHKPSLMGQVFIKLYNRDLPALVHGGYDFVDVRDVAQAAILAMEKGRKGEKYIASGTWKTIAELAALVAKVTGKKSPSFTSPHWMAMTGLPFLNLFAHISGKQPLYTRESLDVLRNAHRNVSHDKATQELGFNPRPLEETIKDIYLWFDEHQYLKRK